MKFKFLGTSDSAGMPVHNCKCVACEKYRTASKTNLATCAVLELKGGVILFDAGHENLANLLDGVKIKGICLTHFHADHALGLLKLRYSNDSIICHHPKDELGFSDLFKHKKSIIYKENTELKPIFIDNIKIIPVPLKHSKNTSGYIIETPTQTIAYLTDCAGIKDKYLKILQTYNFDYVFVDACFAPPKQGNHLNYKSASELLNQLNTKNGYLIHQGHETLAYILENDVNLKYKYASSNQEFLLDS